MKNLIPIALFALFFVHSVTSCTLAGQTIPHFDSTEYVFVGEVTGYTEPVKFSERENAAATAETIGLTVKVKEQLFLPKPAKFFEVFSFDMYADCSLAGDNKGKLESQFPIGSEVRVIAKEAKYLIGPNNRGTIRLENRPEDLSSVSLNTERSSNRITLVSSIFDYKTFEFDYDKEDQDSHAEHCMIAFEIRKDLLRLKNASTRQQKDAILNRLFYAPIGPELNFYAVFKKYSSSKAEFNKRYEDRLRMTGPDIYPVYMALKETRIELARHGYSHDRIENALSKAIGEGTKVKTANLVKKCEEILKKKP